MADVTLRKGAGAAVFYQSGLDHGLYMSHSPAGETGSWSEPVRCNDTDLRLGSGSTVERLATGGWGALTTVGSAHLLYFDLTPMLSRISFETGDTTGWSSVVQ